MLRFLLLGLALLLPGLAAAQTDLSLGIVTVDRDSPVKVTADSTSYDLNTGRAVLSGNVIVTQGDFRIGAGQVEVFFDAETSAVTRLIATGGITFVTTTEAAEAASADYDLGTGLLLLDGGVLLSRGNTALSADRMTVNLRDGTAQLDGRVETVFFPEDE